MKTKLFTALVVLILCISGCDSGDDPPFKKKISIPYHSQLEYNFCGVACIQMWAERDGQCLDQYYIAATVGVFGDGAHPVNIRDGINAFTSSLPRIAMRSWDEPDAQGDLLAGAVKGIIMNYPSIVPFYDGTHAVIVRGFEWHENADTGKPVAEVMFYHDPDPWEGENQALVANMLKDYYFTPTGGDYWIILPLPTLVDAGVVSHIQFIMEGGTYYGGPSVYDPKGILPPIN